MIFYSPACNSHSQFLLLLFSGRFQKSLSCSSIYAYPVCRSQNFNLHISSIFRITNLPSRQLTVFFFEDETTRYFRISEASYFFSNSQ